jgi:hypothetical protein
VAPFEISVVQILAMLCEGSSMRSISRVADVSITTVSKPLVDAGLTDKLWSTTDLAEMIDSTPPEPGKRGPYNKRGPYKKQTPC